MNDEGARASTRSSALRMPRQRAALSVAGAPAAATVTPTTATTTAPPAIAAAVTTATSAIFRTRRTLFPALGGGQERSTAQPDLTVAFDAEHLDVHLFALLHHGAD